MDCIKHKSMRHEGAVKDLYSQSYGFSSSHVWMWELNYQEYWVPKNWCIQTVLEKTLEGPLDCKKIKPVNPKGNQLWIFIRRTDAEAETPILWLPVVISQFTGKTLIWGKIEGKRRRGQQRMRWFYSITDSVDMNLRNLWEIVKNRKAWCAVVHGIAELDMI